MKLTDKEKKRLNDFLKPYYRGDMAVNFLDINVKKMDKESLYGIISFLSYVALTDEILRDSRFMMGCVARMENDIKENKNRLEIRFKKLINYHEKS